jgi:tetratricopeptide (TPR) repeat protein
MLKARPSNSPKQIRLAHRRWLCAGLALLGIISLVCLLVLIPAIVRALPGRYAARLPGFIQNLRHQPHPAVLPTAAIDITPAALFIPTPTKLHLGGVTFVTATPAEPRDLKPTRSPAHQTTSTSSRLTDEPTASPVPATLTPTHSPTSTPIPLPARASLPPITHTYQTWNNCGPATLSMALSYFHRTENQADAAAFLKPDPEDKNVDPYEMAAYARSLELEAMVRVGGDLTRLKQLIAAGLPVVVETWFIPEPGDQMGHYRLLTGYDDDARQFITHDSYNGPNVPLDYDAFDELWRVFNRLYLVIYQPFQARQLTAILGDDADRHSMYASALETAQTEAANPNTECVAYEACTDETAFAWFNIGSNLTALGRHQEAAAAYDQARLLGLPWRMLWYQFGPYASYYAVGRYDDVVTLATVTLNITDNLEESHYWRGMALLAQGETDRAHDDFKAALKYNPNFEAATKALESLE